MKISLGPSEGGFRFSRKNGDDLACSWRTAHLQWRLSSEALPNGRVISYGAEFPTEAGKWLVAEIPFQKLVPSWRGQKLEGPPLVLDQVKEIGILIGDQKAGDFALKVDWVAVK